MQGVLPAKAAILIHLQAIGVIFLVFESIVIALLALAAGQCDFDSHSDGTSYSLWPP